MHIVCALAYEHRALRRAAIDGVALTGPCGPGAEAIERWAERFERTHGAAARERGAPIVLAGLAGGLRDQWPAGAAAWISVVRMEDGRELSPPFPSRRPNDPARAAICSSGAVVPAKAERLALAERTGCDLVDQEATAFAEAGERRGWRWGIVRGVSDGLEDPLPTGIERWVDEQGRSRLGRIARDLLHRPSEIAMTARLSRRGKQAMIAVAARVAETLRQG